VVSVVHACAAVNGAGSNSMGNSRSHVGHEGRNGQHFAPQNMNANMNAVVSTSQVLT